MIVFNWLIGFGLSRTANYFIGKLFTRDLPKKLDNEVNNWCKTIPSDLWLHPTALFSFRHNHETSQPHHNELVAAISSYDLPNIEIWEKALFERVDFIKNMNFEETQPFFSADKEKIAPYINELAIILNRACRFDEKIFRNVVIDKLQELTEKIDNISIKPEESEQSEFIKLKIISLTLPNEIFESILSLVFANTIYKTFKSDRKYYQFKSFIHLDKTNTSLPKITLLTHESKFYASFRNIKNRLIKNYKEEVQLLNQGIPSDWQTNYILPKNSGLYLYNFIFDEYGMEQRFEPTSSPEVPVIYDGMTLEDGYELFIKLISNQPIVRLHFDSNHPGAEKMLLSKFDIKSIDLTEFLFDVHNNKHWEYNFEQTTKNTTHNTQ